jgi:hypothetical protein
MSLRPKIDPSLKKQNTTIRLEPELRKKLEAIASFEYRPLANQIHVFLIEAVERYFEKGINIFYDEDLGEVQFTPEFIEAANDEGQAWLEAQRQASSRSRKRGS